MKNKKPYNITDFLEERNESLTEPPSYPYISDAPTFKVAIYPNKGKGGNKDNLTYDYDIVKVSPKQLHTIFESGNFATTNIFSGSEKGKFHRKKTNFKESSVIQIDIDNKPGDGEYFSIDELQTGESTRAKRIRNLAFGFYSTNSHSEEKHKFRIYFITEKPIKSLKKYEKLMKVLAKNLPFDKVPLHAAAYFYGAGENCCSGVFGNIITNKQVKELIESYKETDFNHFDRDIDNAGIPPELRIKIDKKLEELEGTKLHYRHNTLLKISREISKLVYKNDISLWENFSDLLKNEIENVARELKKYDVPGNKLHDYDINRTIDDGWRYGSQNNPSSLRLFNNRPIGNMDAAPRDVIVNIKESSLNISSFEDETDKANYIKNVINSPDTKKMYLAICKFAESRVTRSIKNIKAEEIIRLMHTGTNNEPTNQHIKYETKKLLEKIEYLQRKSFQLVNRKTGEVSGFSLITEYEYNRETGYIKLISIPKTIQNMATFFPSDIYELKGKAFNFDFELWIYANRNFSWYKKNSQWNRPNYEKKPLMISRKTLCKYALVDNYTDEYKKNQKLKDYLGKIKKLGHIKTIPNISGKSDKTYPIYFRNVYKNQKNW